MNKARQFMGYCPQFDALDELLTGKEVLSYFARIRGMSKSDGDKVVHLRQTRIQNPVQDLFDRRLNTRLHCLRFLFRSEINPLTVNVPLT